MNSSKKIILMCLIPAVLTVFFIFWFTVPAVSQCLKLNKQITNKKIAIKKTKITVASLETNKKLANRLEEMNAGLIGFNAEFPAEFRDEILLIDLEIFANEAANRIVGLQSLGEREIEIIDPEDKDKKKKRRRKKEKTLPPLQIMEKPFDINTVAYYSELIDFVDFLETYQRKVNINGISAKIFDDGTDSLDPRIDLKIRASTYKSVINEIKEEEEKDEQPKK